MTSTDPRDVPARCPGDDTTRADGADTVGVSAHDGADDAQEALRGTLSERTGMHCVRLGPEGGEMTMPVEGNTQPAGLLHGGATIALAETIASMAAFARAREVHGPRAQAVGTSVAATHHRSGRSGIVTAHCRALHLGRQVASYLVEVVDEQERLLSTIQVSTMLLPPRG